MRYDSVMKIFALVIILAFALIGCRPSGLHDAYLAIKYRQEATRLDNSLPAGLVSQRELDPVFKLQRKALYHAEKVDPEALNDYCPGFGDHFKDEFLPSLRLFVKYQTSHDVADMFRAHELHDRWVDWYNANLDRLRGD